MRARAAEQTIANNALLIPIDASEQTRRDGIAKAACLARVRSYQRGVLKQAHTQILALRGELAAAQKQANG